jgi:hypothetical protein
VLTGKSLLESVSEARAQIPIPPQATTCVWSYITDGGSPELGTRGKVKMDEEWKAMSQGGWRLVAIAAQGDNRPDYVCGPHHRRCTSVEEA